MGFEIGRSPETVGFTLEPHKKPHTKRALRWDGLLRHEISFNTKSTAYLDSWNGNAPQETLLQILDLLAHLLDENLQLDRNSGQFRCYRLGSQGVGFAVELLH